MKKGIYKSICYRAVCSNTPAVYFNQSTQQHYCEECAKLINEVNKAELCQLVTVGVNGEAVKPEAKDLPDTLTGSSFGEEFKSFGMDFNKESYITLQMAGQAGGETTIIKEHQLRESKKSYELRQKLMEGSGILEMIRNKIFPYPNVDRRRCYGKRVGDLVTSRHRKDKIGRIISISCGDNNRVIVAWSGDDKACDEVAEWLEILKKVEDQTVLHLNLKKKWFDMIASGEKPEEYCEIKPFWIKRLQFDVWNPRPFDIIEFRNGYATDAPSIRVVLEKIRVGIAQPQWCEVGGDMKDCYILELGVILQ